MQLADGAEAISDPATAAWIPDVPGEPQSDFDPASSDPTVDPPSDGITTDEARIAQIELDPRYRMDFEGLLYLGAISDEFDWAGHTFSIRTLTTDEILEIGLLVKAYADTIGENRAYITAVVAASLERVDGHPIHSPLGPNESSISEKFRYISESWYPWTTDRIYQQCMALEARVAQIVEAMGGASG